MDLSMLITFSSLVGVSIILIALSVVFTLLRRNKSQNK
jgi:hypothetical protein